MSNPNTPVLVGVGQFLNRIDDLDQALEPLEMMLRAVALAERDTGVGGLLPQVRSVRVTRGIWSYENPARAIAERIGAAGAETVGTLIGGNQNQAVVNRTADDILAGRTDLVLITGAENGYSANKARKAGRELPQTQAPGTYDFVIGAAQQPEHHEFEVAKGIRQAIQVYPMYDNAIRHGRGETLGEHIERVSGLWARFNDVAQDNPNAWVRQDMSAEEIRTASPSNRQISFPYTKYMNANMMVDMGAALIMCSVAKAKALGIAEDRWVYPHVGARGYDHFSASVREELPLLAGHPNHRRQGDGIGRNRPGRARLRRSLQLLPVRRAGGGEGTRARRGTAAHRHRWPHLRWRPAQQLRHAQHRPHGGTAAGETGRLGADHGQRRQSLQARPRHLLERAAEARLPACEPAERDRCLAHRGSAWRNTTARRRSSPTR